MTNDDNSRAVQYYTIQSQGNIGKEMPLTQRVWNDGRLGNRVSIFVNQNASLMIFS